jgi:hypothetical protein
MVKSLNRDHQAVEKFCTCSKGRNFQRNWNSGAVLKAIGQLLLMAFVN